MAVKWLDEPEAHDYDAAAGYRSMLEENDAVDKTDYKGITAQIKFAENGDLPEGEGTVNLFVVKDGAIVSLGDITKAP